MPYTTEQLLEFDRDRIANFDEAHLHELLRAHPDVARSHLLIAKWLDDWAEGLEADRSEHEFPGALREIAATLRTGEFLPGGPLYEDLAPPELDR